MDAHSTHTIHLVGIAGTGMGAFAGLLKQAGYRVQGSDMHTYPPMSDKLAEWQIPVMTPYSQNNLSKKPDLVVVGNAVSKANPEAKAILEQGISYTSFPKALHDLFLVHHVPIVAAGTHGKTTCSALLAHTLHQAGRDPGFLIGGIPLNFGESFRLPKAKSHRPFVVEGDEYDTAFFDKGPKFLHYAPNFLLATSLEYDHADIYQDVSQIQARFSELFGLVQEKGHIVVCQDAPLLIQALQNAQTKAAVTTYGMHPSADWTLRHPVDNENGIAFDVYYQNKPCGAIHLGLSGVHNQLNALGCYALLASFGLSHAEIAEGFLSFRSVKRRLEVVGEAGSFVVIDDFAHHPTAVQTTLQAAKAKYPQRPLWVLFEPRSASSCRNVFQNDYAKSFDGADRVLLAPIGRNLDPSIALDVAQLEQDINKRRPHTATACSSIPSMVEIVKQEAPKGAVVLCMSNGDFSGVHQGILNACHP